MKLAKIYKFKKSIVGERPSCIISPFVMTNYRDIPTNLIITTGPTFMHTQHEAEPVPAACLYPHAQQCGTGEIVHP